LYDPCIVAIASEPIPLKAAFPLWVLQSSLLPYLFTLRSRVGAEMSFS